MEGRAGLRGGGTVSWREQGPWVEFEARREWDGSGIYKVWLEGGGEVLLGTLEPAGGGLALRRRLSVDSLRRSGCWPPEGGRCVLTGALPGAAGPGGWSREERPERWPQDGLLRRSFGGLAGVLGRREGEWVWLAAPFSPGRPFPVPALFCLGRLERIGEGDYVVWRFDRGGRPWV